MLTSMGAVEGAAVADLFAGSGALGIEALSRGAASAVLVDRSAAAVAAIQANLASVGELPGAATVVRRDALAWALGPHPVDGWDLVLADPPYSWQAWPALLAALRPVTSVFVAETGAGWHPVPGWETVRARGYGTTVVTILEPTEGGGG